MPDVKEVVSMLAKGLVEHPDQVEVTATESGGALSVMIKVAEEDKGKIIGKQGKVIKALRAVAGITATKTNQKVSVDLE